MKQYLSIVGWSLPMLGYSLLFPFWGMAQDYRLFQTFQQHQSAVTHVVFRSEDNLLISGDAEGNLIHWSIDHLRLIKRWKGHTAKVTDINFSPDGRKMVSAGYDGKVQVWSLTDHRKIGTFENPAIAPYANVQGKEPTFSFFISNEVICFGGYNKQVYVANLTNQRLQKIYEAPTGITCGILSPDRSTIAIGVAGEVVLIDTRTYQVIQTLKKSDRYDDFVCELQFVPNSTSIAAWAYNGRIHFFDPSTHQTSRVRSMMASQKKGTSNMAFSEDSKWLVTGNEHHKTKVWQLRGTQAQLVQTLGAHRAAVTCFALSPAGAYIVTGSDDHSIRLWKRTGQTLQVPPEIPATFEGRKVHTQHRVRVKRKKFQVYVWDNRVIDQDIISVNVNGQWLLEKYTLKRKKKRINVTLHQKNNFLLIHALNEGSTPPNTTAVWVKAGKTRKLLLLKATKNSSAAIHFIYDKED